MTYLQRSKSDSKSKKRYILIALVLVFILDISGALTWIVRSITIGSWAKIEILNSFILGIGRSFEDKTTLALQNLSLQRQIAEISNQNKYYQEFLEKNSLWQESEAEIRKYFERVEVVSKYPFLPFDKILFQTQEEKVGEGTGVLIKDGSLLGTVDYISGKIVSVNVFGKSGEKYEMYIGEGKMPVEGEGFGGGSFSFGVFKDVEIKEGDDVFVFLKRFKDGKIVESFRVRAGKVAKIVDEPNESLKRVLGLSDINIFELGEAYISFDYKI